MSTAQNTWTDPSGQQIALRVRPLIEGRLVDSTSSEQWTKYSPRDGQPLMQFAAGSAEDVDRAVRSGRIAFEDGRWSDLPVARRSEVLLKWADSIEREAKSLAALDTLEVGKPIRDAEQIDLALGSGVLRFNAVNADKASGTVVPADSRSICQTTRSPRGVVGAIVGWNFPLVLAIMKAGPALAAGNSLVLKPSELSSLSALRSRRIGARGWRP